MIVLCRLAGYWQVLLLPEDFELLRFEYVSQNSWDRMKSVKEVRMSFGGQTVRYEIPVSLPIFRPCWHPY